MSRKTETASVIAAVSIALAILAFLSDRRDVGRPFSVDAPPHCGGKQVSFDAAMSDAAYIVVLPSDTLASGERLVGTWECPGGGTLMEFDSGVHVQVVENTIEDPRKSWEGVVDGSASSVYSVGAVQGMPALLIDPAKAPRNNPANGGVSFVLDGVHVSVGGNGAIPLSDLIDVAEALGARSKG